jgi:Tfp pilus assembly protein PilF
VSLVEAYIRTNKIDEARKFLESVISKNSDNGTAYILLAKLNMIDDRPAEAEQYYLKSIEINPQLASGYTGLAAMYLQSEKINKSEKILKQGLVRMPKNNLINISLATLYEKLKKIDNSIEIYESMLTSDPKSVVAKNNLANLLLDHKTDKANLSKAFNLATEFKDSEMPELQDTYAWALVQSKEDIEQGLRILKQIVSKNPNTPIYNYHLGEAYYKKGYNSRAEEFLKIAVKYGGEDSETTKKAMKRLQEISGLVESFTDKIN